jgi:peptide/nickel transport system substrate-binding protein
MRTSSARRTVVLALSGALALATAACAKSDRTEGGGGSSTKDTFVFAASSDPKSLDPAFVSDGESIRVARQIFQGLITFKGGTTEIAPDLADSWSANGTGDQYTFKLKSGVQFSDGTPFNAKAVCFNFDRWYNFKGNLLQSSSLSYYWQAVFGGFAKKDNPTAPDKSLYKSCSATDDSTAVVSLTSPSGAFLGSLTLPSFAMQSPDALQKYGADTVGGTEDSPKFTGSYWNQHPTGTGPFKLDKWDLGQQVVLVPNDKYNGPAPKVKRLVFQIISDNNARSQALQNGTIDGYDLVAPEDIKTLQDKGFQLLSRPAFNVGYIGFNQKKAPLDNQKIRQAIAYAINRDALVKSKYPEGAEVAKEFMPPSVLGYSDSVTTYNYDPEKAKTLIKESGVTNLNLEFAYPTDVSRPYMPSPVDNWQLIKADLEKVGFKITQKSSKWSPDYNNATSTGKYQMYLLGWTGDYADPYNFIGTFFGDVGVAVNQFGWDAPNIRSELQTARGIPDDTQRTAAYQKINNEIMEELPGIPYVHTKPYLAFKNTVKGFVPSPTQNETFDTVTVS